MTHPRTPNPFRQALRLRGLGKGADAGLTGRFSKGAPARDTGVPPG
jgi:hypothetical protein